ncbi:MAG TPA: ABC-2 family transporter protein [Anaerolineaceae bacterium]
MNHRGGWALIKRTWMSWIQDRGFFFVLAFGWMIPPLVALFAWMAAAGNGTIAGMDRRAFAGYYLVLVLVNQLTYSQTNWTLGDIIREGMLDSWLLRPLSPFYQVLSSEVAGKVVYMVFVIPATGLLAILLQPKVDISPSRLGLFLLALILAWGLRFFWGYWLALIAFWASRADALLAVQDSLVFLLSGVVAPIALLSPSLQTAAILLPFRYMVGFPVEILTRPLSDEILLQGLAIQIAWLMTALLLTRIVWRAGIRHYASARG